MLFYITVLKFQNKSQLIYCPNFTHCFLHWNFPCADSNENMSNAELLKTHRSEIQVVWILIRMQAMWMLKIFYFVFLSIRFIIYKMLCIWEGKGRFQVESSLFLWLGSLLVLISFSQITQLFLHYKLGVHLCLKYFYCWGSDSMFVHLQNS